jgi:glutamyl-Q tRNA(Asp) synthetase
MRQSDRFDHYAAAIERLRRQGALRECRCSRSALARLPENESRPAGVGEDLFHPADCLPTEASNGSPGHALRLRVPAGRVEFDDRSLGRQSVDIQTTAGDFVLQRRDRLFAYQLAVVVDDADQRITDVVRGCDLLASSARQVVLQQRLGLPAVRYLHLPLAVDDRGLKLSKSDPGTPAVSGRGGPTAELAAVLGFLGQSPPADLPGMPLREAWDWAVAHWRVEGFAGCAMRAAPYEANAGTAG